MPRLSADARHAVRFTLNGRAVEGEAEPRMLLTDFLRHVLGMTGTHVGCEHGVCGACTIDDRRRAGARLPDVRRAGGRRDAAHGRGAGAAAGPAIGAAGGVPPPSRAAMRLLHRRHPDVARHLSAQTSDADAKRNCANSSAAICAAAPAMCRSSPRRSTRHRRLQGGAARCLISAPAFVASVERDPRTRSRSSTVDVRLTYRAMVPAHLRARARLRRTRPEARRPSRRPCCRTAGRRRPSTGPASSPASSSRRSTGAPTADEIDFCLEDAEARAVVYEDISADAIASFRIEAQSRARIAVDGRRQSDIAFESLFCRTRSDAEPRAAAEAWSVMLYTSGTTAQAEGRAAPPARRTRRRPLAHVAQNLYGRGERTLGVMPLYHTMGVRSLLAMSLIGGAFVCLPRFDARAALELIERRKDHQSLSRADALSRPRCTTSGFKTTDVSSVRKLGFAGAPDDRRAAARNCTPRSSRTCSSITTARRKSTPSPSTRTRRQSRARPAAPASTRCIRVVKLGATSPDELAAVGEEGEIIALLAGDESFEGYWRRPDADAKALRAGLVLHRRHRLLRRRRRPVRHRPRRRHDHHRRRERLAGRDRKLPVAAPRRVGSGRGRPARRALGQDRRRLRQAPRRGRAETELDQFCRTSGLANFKRPRRYVFVEDIPKSPVGKLLRRKLVAGEYQAEGAARNPKAPRTKPHELADDLHRSRAWPRSTASASRSTPRSERADIILDRPPLQRHRRCRSATSCGSCSRRSTRTRACASSCCARSASTSPPAATSRASWKPRPSMSRKLAWNIAAPARCVKPVIAANRGYCFGVGFEISLACDFRIVSETCHYALPEQKLGQIPGSGGSARLQKIVGITRTKDIVMRSTPHSGKQALRLGHRHRMRAGRRAGSRHRRAGRRTAARSRRSPSAPPRSCSTTPRTPRCRSRSSWKAIATAGLRQSDDFREGVEAFHAKRPAKFKELKH